MVLSCCLTFVPAAATLVAAEPPVVLLWPAGAPGSEGRGDERSVRVTDGGDHVVVSVHRPSLALHLPPAERATGAAVLVIPGGGHRELWVDHEGHNVAAWLAERGVAAFVLEYRLARQEGSTYTIEGHALADTQRALRLIRHRATEWRVDPARLGVMGFSAGGELAARASLVFEAGDPAASDPVNRAGSKPAFQALVYPGNSRIIAPTAESPPAFLCWGFRDRPDIAEGMAGVYLAFKKSGVPAEMHVFSDAGHGFGVRLTTRGPVARWPELFLAWLDGRGLLASAAAAP